MSASRPEFDPFVNRRFKEVLKDLEIRNGVLPYWLYELPPTPRAIQARELAKVAELYFHAADDRAWGDPPICESECVEPNEFGQMCLELARSSRASTCTYDESREEGHSLFVLRGPRGSPACSASKRPLPAGGSLPRN